MYEDQEVLVIDLYKRIYDQEKNIAKGFLVIFLGKKSLCGITIILCLMLKMCHF
jgi:hypothetical protein